jgi:soluble lytic murein transglycosylase-like protein
MKRSNRWVPVLAVAAAAMAQPAIADIFSFTDESGVVHFTNIPSNDKRYRLVRKETPATPAVPTTTTISLRNTSISLPDALIQRYAGIVESASRTHGVDKSLVHAVILAESGYNPVALSRAGARGLMQLMPETAKRYGVRNIFDPVENVNAGVRYLKDLIEMFNGNLELAVAAYNAGENAVVKHGNRIPPYAETVHYVPKVLGFYRRFQVKHGSA